MLIGRWDCLLSGQRSYCIRWRIKYWLLAQCYHTSLLQLIRRRADIADEKTRGGVSFWIVIRLIQSWIAKQGFFSFASITRKQEREQLAFRILLLLRWTCLEDKDNLSTWPIWSATIQHIVSLVVIIAHRRVFNTCRGEKETSMRVIFWFDAAIRTTQTGSVYLFFHSTGKMRIKENEDDRQTRNSKDENEERKWSKLSRKVVRDCSVINRAVLVLLEEEKMSSSHRIDVRLIIFSC